MAKVSPLQESFNAGEFSPLVAARVRFEKYQNAVQYSLNMIPMVQGGMTRRSGTMFVNEVKASEDKTRLVQFEYSVTQSYVLEFGDQYIRFYKDRGVLETSGVAAWLTGTAYVVGDLRTETGVTYYCTTAHTSGTFATDLAAGKWYAQTGTTYEIPTTYLEAELFDLKFTQSADVLYITHPSHPPRKLSRTGATAWTLTAIDFKDGPYLPTNNTDTTITPSGTTGSVTLTASTSIFASTDVGRLVRIKHSSTWGYAKITAFTSGTVVSATVQSNFGSTGAVKDWRLGLWSVTTGYPSCVTFFEDRLFFAGNAFRPQRIDGSIVGDYENFAPSATDGLVADDNAIAVSLNANDVNVIRWMIDDEKGLLIGTVSGEWIVRPSSLNEAITPTNIAAKRSTAFGSANIQAIRTGKASIYVQRAGRKLRELAYVYEVDGFRSPDMNILSDHILDSGVVEITYQQEPYSVVWCVRNDGQLVGLTYERDQDVVGWHRHIIGGSFGSGDAVVESVAVIPTPAGDADEVWMIVKRTIDGATKRYVEYMTPKFDAATAVDAFFVDSGLTYDSTPTTTISGLDHLEGETLSVLADGASHPDVVVASGAVTLNRSSSVVHLGLPYVSDIETLRIEAGAQDGTAQGKTKRIHRVTVRIYRSLGLQFGPNENSMDVLPFRTSSDTMGNPPALFTGDKSVNWNDGYNTSGVMYFRQSQPLPFTLLGIMPQLVTQDRG